jgi:hypothetical protein
MIEKVLGSIEPLQREIVNHELYTHIERPQDLHRFMEQHVYAVWDFMSLLKALQIQLTGTTLPWTPKGDPEIRYLINEIVLAEETDLDLDGQRKSHFEMYLNAMTDAGASTEKIMMLIGKVSQGLPWHKAAVESHRKLIGATKPLEAEPGTIRGDLAVNIGRNVIHGSDAAETAAFEIGLWFESSELNDWSPSDQEWRVEG